VSESRACTWRWAVVSILAACGAHEPDPTPRAFDATISDAARPGDAAVGEDTSSPAAEAAVMTRADGGPDVTPLPDPTKLTPGCFASSGVTPQLTKGSLFAGANWNDPSVTKQGSQYVMYASSDHDFDGAVSIYRLVSQDGENWELDPKAPVLAPAAAVNAWDHKSVETPSVVWFRGAYHMFYTGYPIVYSDTASYRIGHAVSKDGIAWTRDSEPLIAPTCPGWTPTDQTCSPGGAPTDFDAFLVAEPGAVVFKDQIYLYFAASGYDSQLADPLFTIGLVTSTDANSWSSPRKVLAPDQNLYPRSMWLGYSTPAAVVVGPQVHLFFDVVQDTPFAQLALHHAHSATGASDFVQDAKAIFSSSTFAFTAREIRAPGPLLDGTWLRLWFAGDDGGPSPTLSIAEATCAL